jgi:hypothetical protein
MLVIDQVGLKNVTCMKQIRPPSAPVLVVIIWEYFV